MDCFHCHLQITGRVRWSPVDGTQQPFHSPSTMYDCVNEHLKSIAPPRATETYTMRRYPQHA